MVPSSADIVLQNCRISQSETSTMNICECDVLNTTFLAVNGAVQHTRVSGDPSYVTSSVFYVIVRFIITETFGYIPTNEPRHAL